MAIGGVAMKENRTAETKRKNPNPTDILGSPDKPPDVTLTGPGGKLRDEFRMTAEPDLATGFASQLRGTEKAPGDLQRLRQRGMAEGLSPQMDMMRQAQTQRAKEQGAAAGANAIGNLAMRGGADAGARERVSGATASQTQRGMQDINLQTGIADEQQKLGIQMAMPGMNLQQEGAILGAQQADTGRREGAQKANILGQYQNIENIKDRFKEQMTAMGNERMAKIEEERKK